MEPELGPIYRMGLDPGQVENDLEETTKIILKEKVAFRRISSKIDVICWVSGPRVGTKVDPDPFKLQVPKNGPGLFTYQNLNKDPNLIITG